MWQAWTEISQANVDNFNEHPVVHGVVIATYGVVAAVVLSKMFAKLTKTDQVDAPIK